MDLITSLMGDSGILERIELTVVQGVGTIG